MTILCDGNACVSALVAPVIGVHSGRMEVLYGSPETAIEMCMSDNGWETINGKDYCHYCKREVKA